MTLFINFLSHSSNMQLHFLSNKKPCIPPDQNIYGAGIWGSSMPPSTSFVDLLKLGAVISPTSKITKIPSMFWMEKSTKYIQIPGCRHEPQQFTTGPLCVACLRLQFARRRRVSAPQSFGWKRSMIQRVDIPYTLPETNISTRGKGKIIFNSALVGEIMLVPRKGCIWV